MALLTHLQAIRRSLAVLSVIAIFATCYVARDLLLPILLGVLIALTLSPVNRWLARSGVPHAVSAVTIIGATAAAIVIAIYFSAGTIAAWLQDSRQIGALLEARLAGVSEQIENVKEASEQVAELANGSDDTPEQQVVVQRPSLLSSAMSVLGDIGATLAVALVLASFLLASGDAFYLRLVQSFKKLSDKKRALQMVYDIERQVSRYLLTITLINAGLGVAVGAAMMALGISYGYVWGVAAFLLNFLPYIGALIGTGAVAVIAVVTFPTFGQALLPPLAYLTLTSIEGQFITPWLVGRRLEINSVAVLLTVVVWGWLWGIPGALVAVPFLVVFRVVCANIASLQVMGNFLAATPRRPGSPATTQDQAPPA